MLSRIKLGSFQMIQEKTLRPLHPLPKAVSNRLVKLHREKWWASSTFNLFFSCLLSLSGERIELNWWKDQIRFAPCKPCYLKTGFGHFTFSPAVSLNKCTTHYKMHTEQSRAAYIWTSWNTKHDTVNTFYRSAVYKVMILRLGLGPCEHGIYALMIPREY